MKLNLGLPDVFQALQMLFQGVLESVVLLDRVHFLDRYKGIQTKMVNLFDVSISPRNMAIIAEHKQTVIT